VVVVAVVMMLAVVYLVICLWLVAVVVMVLRGCRSAGSCCGNDAGGCSDAGAW